jgi:D-alanyl-D-alanine carboxypeptidase/D-alanyl-D-alanine-endopeptidase (penicillin-binding protein 4)
LSSLILFSCATAKNKQLRRARALESLVAQSAVFSQAFTGFTLLDPESGKTLADYYGDRLFIPASNAKILTLATCLRVLGDTLPGMELIRAEGKLLFRGTADPTFLHPDFQAWQSCFDTLKRHIGDSVIYYYPHQFPVERFGPGWAWDDYNDYYQAERSEMPIYGNCMSVSHDLKSGWRVEPPLLRHQVYSFPQGTKGVELKRLEHENVWALMGGVVKSTLVSPMRMGIFGSLLADTLGYKVESISHTEHPYHRLFPTETLPSAPTDTVLRRMMHQSDNFIAEQLLLVCSGQKFDVFQPDTVINWALDSVLVAMPQRPRWVDGSGLSRYNLISPRSLAQVLLLLWREQPRTRLLSLFPAGGVSGTISDWYKGQGGKPYVWAKTGSMSGVHCLSGYVSCKSGKVLVFSFMHNHFIGSNRPWKQEMQRVLEEVWEGF